MMNRGRERTGLAPRLERLTGKEAARCLPEYEHLSREIVRSPVFSVAIRRARALADARRLTAVALLRRRGELCACEIQAALGVSHATVSHHMAVLAKAGLVAGTRRGKWMYYRLATKGGLEVP